MFLTASFAESLCPIVEFVGLGKHHGHYTDEELDVKLTHVEPKDTLDQMAYNAVKLVRLGFDSVTGWKHDNITINNILNRTIYLETIAAVPGMVAAIVRHFKSLRTMKADGGYLQLFLEEANNEQETKTIINNYSDLGEVVKLQKIYNLRHRIGTRGFLAPEVIFNSKIQTKGIKNLYLTPDNY